MNSAAKEQAKQLPRVEWDFYELDELEVKVAFWYEFSRGSDEVKKQVGKMRASRQPQHPHVWYYSPHEHRLYKVISEFARLDTFPETPFLTLKEKAIAAVKEKRARLNRDLEQMIAGTHPFKKLPPGCKVFAPTKPDEPVETLEWMVEARLNKPDFRPQLGYPGFVNFGDHKAVRAWREAKAGTVIFPLEMEKFTPHPEFSALEWTINWNMPDAELVWYFEEALRRGRPRQFKELAEKPTVQLSFDGAFPFRRSAALQWLGELRKRRAVKTWREYLELYESKKLCERNGRGAKSRDIQALARPRERNCRKAELILEWFDKGTPLNKQDFK